VSHLFPLVQIIGPDVLLVQAKPGIICNA